MSTPWGTAPFATSTPVIDGVMQHTAPAPTPVPIPGLTPPFPQFMTPQASVPYMGMPYMGMPYMGMPYMGMQSQFMTPQIPVPYLGMPHLGMPHLGMAPQFMTPQFMTPPIPYMGMTPQFMTPQAPYLGVPPLGFHPGQALGLDMQTTPWPIAGLGGHHVISPVAIMLLQQLGLREAVSRIGDEALKRRVTDNVNEAIDHTIESLSGMTLQPWSGPGAQFMIYPIAAQLALIAQRYPEGTLREALLTIAGQILQKSVAPTGESAGRHK